MLNHIIDFSIRRRGLVLIAALLASAAGAISLGNLSIDAFPDVTDVMVQINTTAPSLGTLEVEQQISAKVETAIAGIPNLKLVRSMSKFGLSQVTAVFEDGTEIERARVRVMERLSRVNLPAGLERPAMGPVATGLGEIFHYIVTAPGGDLTDARTTHDWVIKPRLLSAGGVAEVNAWGGRENQFQVLVDPDRLVKHGVTLGDVIGTLERANANVGGGLSRGAGEILLVHGVGATSTTDSIGAITIAAVDGRPVRIRDVADVAEGHEIRRGVVTSEGRGEVVLGLGFLLMGENSHVVAARLREKMEEVKGDLAEKGYRIQVLYDRTELVDVVIGTVRKNLFEGALLVVAVLFLFLGHLRAALIVASAIPLSMLFAFSLMLQAGIAGTLMSLGAIDFGLIVDSSVIMVENAVRRLREDRTGRSPDEIVAEAAKEVRKPTLFGELIIMIVYVPILALVGVEGKLFKPMALTVLFALGGSLLFSLTVMPALASRLLSRRSVSRGEPWIVGALKRLYRPALRFAVERRVLVMGSALIVVLGTIPMAARRGAVFVPKLDEGSIVINVVRFPGISIEEQTRVSTAVERTLKERFPSEIRSIWTRTGTPEVATDPMGIEVSDVFVMLTPREGWREAATKEELLRKMDDVLKPLPGMNYAFTQPIEMRFNEMIAGIRTDVGVRILGDDLEALKTQQAKVLEIVKGISGAASPTAEPMAGQPVLRMRLDDEAIARHGLKPADILEVIEAAGGIHVGEVRVDQRTFPLAVRLPGVIVDNPDRFGGLPVTTPDGRRLPLSTLVKIERVTGPTVVWREWGKRRALVTTNVAGRDLGSFVVEAKEKIEERLGKELRDGGMRVEFGGQYENLARATETLTYVVPLALLLILLLVYATYGNLPDSLRVFTGVPFAMVGGLLALWLRDMPFSVSAAVGFIALSGVSVLADMVMVSTIRQCIDAGMAVREAVLEAAERRLRPVLMTALVASLGFIPMAFNTGVGAEVQRPLATVVIGGLITSTLLTLFVLPALYVTLRGKQ